jgi:FG-GAP-like repeat/EF hand
VLFLIWAMWLCVVASPGWAAPRFGRPGTYAVDGSPVTIDAGAVDAQAGREVVTANEAGAEGPSLSILSNRGQGSFFPEQRVNVDASTYILHAVAVGDFNADGAADLAAAVDDITAFPIRGSVLVYLNDGTGGFARPVQYKLNGFFPRAIAVGDVNGDGALDLVIAFAQSGGTQGLFTMLAGQRNAGSPTGAFAATTTTTVGAAPSAIDLGDLDGDGHVDALLADRDGGAVFVLYGTGTAAPFGAPVTVTLVTAPVSALIDDAPGLTHPQVLIATRNSGRLRRLTQPAPRTFASPVDQTIGFLPEAMALADMTADGIKDLVVVSALGAELWTGASDGTFTFAESIVGNDDSLDRLVIADLNGDDKPDIAASASTQDRVTVALNGADVPFTPAPTATVTPTAVATPTATRGPVQCVGDCDGDGQVSINELIQGVNIALNTAAVDACPAFDRDGDGQVSVNELIAGVNSALGGCPAA